MQNHIKKWLKKALAITSLSCALIALFGTSLSANAFTVIYTEVHITEHSVVSTSIDTDKGEKIELKYCLDAPAYVTTGIYKATGDYSSEKVDILENFVEKAVGCYNLSWDGENGAESEVGTYGEKVVAGQYFYGIKADAVPGKSIGGQYVSAWINVTTDSEDGSGDDDSSDNELRIVDVDIDNKIFDPYDDQEVGINFLINQKAYITLEIYDEDNDKVVTLIDEKLYEKGDYSKDWDGKDKSGDIVDQGDYEYKLIAEYGDEKDTEKGEITVKKGYDIDPSTEDPRIKNHFVTKDSFDPGRNEELQIIFSLSSDADVKVTLYDEEDNKIEELLDEDNLDIGTYKVVWDGYGYEGDQASFSYKIIAENSKGEDEVKGTFKVEEDSKSSKKPNVFKDSLNPVIFKPQDSSLGLSFKLDRDAQVTLEIKDGDYVIATVVEEVDMVEGPHTIDWDGMDKYGEYAENGIYTYKLIAENNYGKDVETGKFEVQETGEAKHNGGSCATFTDVDEDYKYCEAIEWANSEGIFEGYSDETFKPTQAINRVEALKVVLKAMNVKILSSSGDNLGFPDVDKYGWYMPYLKTALSLGIVAGYPDGTFKPDKPVAKIEALVMMLNTGKVKYNIVIPSNTYGQPYYDTPNATDTKWYLSYAWFAQSYDLTDNEYYLFPESYMTRGEMADMLYRYHKASLDT